jgi:hypothetical protein
MKLWVQSPVPKETLKKKERKRDRDKEKERKTQFKCYFFLKFRVLNYP